MRRRTYLSGIGSTALLPGCTLVNGGNRSFIIDNRDDTAHSLAIEVIRGDVVWDHQFQLSSGAEQRFEDVVEMVGDDSYNYTVSVQVDGNDSCGWSFGHDVFQVFIAVFSPTQVVMRGHEPVPVDLTPRPEPGEGATNGTTSGDAERGTPIDACYDRW